MQRVQVESSDIVSVGYDPTGKLLEVEFHGGRIYQYKEVEPAIYEQFMRAESYGTFFFAHINGRYRYSKISDSGDSSSGTLSLVAASEADLHDFQVACEPYDLEVESLALPVDEIQSEDADDIAAKKAKQAYKLAAQPVVVTTSFWNILALHGFPGAYIDAAAGWFTTDDLLRLLEDKQDRAVCLTQVVAYYDGKRQKICKQDYWGKIIDQPAGEGNSFERLIVMNGRHKTVAELRVEDQPGWTADTNPWIELAKWLRLQRRLYR